MTVPFQNIVISNYRKQDIYSIILNIGPEAAMLPIRSTALHECMVHPYSYHVSRAQIHQVLDSQNNHDRFYVRRADYGLDIFRHGYCYQTYWAIIEALTLDT